jgi:MFS family permease
MRTLPQIARDRRSAIQPDRTFAVSPMNRVRRHADAPPFSRSSRAQCPMREAPPTAPARIPAGVWVLGFVSLLMDISSEMIHSLLPLFLVGTLGVSVLAVGVIEGIAESTALISKVFSGALSDYLGRRKGLALFGYALGAVTKPVFALANGVGVIVAARFIDRVGKGIRGAPRDALVADITPSAIRGAAFGLRQSLDTVGAFVGPLLATALMLLWANDFRAVFWVAAIPGLLAVALLAFGVREPARTAAARARNPISREALVRLGRAYWGVVAVGAVFTLARFSEAFLVLRAAQLGVATAWVPLVMVAMNLVYAATAYPFGKLSDTMSHRTLLALGLVVLVASDLVLALASGWALLGLGVALWGVHMGMTQGLLAAMVADTAPEDLRGTAYGLFNLLSGVAMLASSAIACLLWDAFGSSFTFYAGAAFAALTLAGLASPVFAGHGLAQRLSNKSQK